MEEQAADAYPNYEYLVVSTPRYKVVNKKWQLYRVFMEYFGEDRTFNFVMVFRRPCEPTDSAEGN